MNFRFRNTSYSINPSVGSIVFIVAVVLITGALANWQYQRGMASQARLAQAEYQANRSVQTLTKETAAPKNFTTLAITGKWLQPTLLLDSQLHTLNTQKRIGYHVYSPFQTSAGILLIRRGWLEKQTNDNLYSIATTLSPSAQETLTVVTYTPEINRFQTYWPETLADDPAIIPSLNLSNITQSFALPLLPFVGHLQAPLTRDTNLHGVKTHQTQYLTPDKHFAYALQWLLLMLIAPIIYGLALVKKTHQTGELPPDA